jgi:hypothetical protein
MRYLQSLSWSGNSPHFKEPEGLLQFSQKTITDPHLEPDESIP